MICLRCEVFDHALYPPTGAVKPQFIPIDEFVKNK